VPVVYRVAAGVGMVWVPRMVSAMRDARNPWLVHRDATFEGQVMNYSLLITGVFNPALWTEIIACCHAVLLRGTRE